MTTATQQPVRTIGTDRGYGDIFRAQVRYEDGSNGCIVVYGGNLQMTNYLLEAFSPIWKFTTLELS